MPGIEQYIINAIETALKGKLQRRFTIELEIPRNPGYGDLTSNIAFRIAKELRQSPQIIAEQIAETIEPAQEFIEGVSVAGGGFLNFTCSRAYLRETAANIVAAPEEFGWCDLGEGRRVNLEFVSANPTGPLNVVSARAAALGDSLKKLLNFCGYSAAGEFYINDAGAQVLKLGHSLITRYAELHDIEAEPFPQDGYQGEYVKAIAHDYTPPPQLNWKNLLDQDKAHAGAFAVAKNVDWQRQSLEKYGVNFDHWVKESSIRKKGEHLKIRDRLEKEKKTYWKDGALYFKTSEFGDDEDRVIWTSDDRPTYFLPDIAYHQDKFSRGFDWLIDIWGPDHHGYIPRMKAAIAALGKPEQAFTVIIAQQVNLIRAGQRVMMSKRAGEMITIDDLMEEVGNDAARFFFLQRKATAHLDFDLDLAVKETEENPVFYVQYAHARICSIERYAAEAGIPLVPEWERLTEEGEFALIRKLMQFPVIVRQCARALEPQSITVYLQETAAAFHSFYQKFRVVTDDPGLSSARLGLCRAVRGVIGKGLYLLGVSAPERM